MEGHSADDSEIQLVHLMAPSDATHIRRVHGGVLMRLADEAGGLAATRHARGTCVTVVMDSMTFEAPVLVGDLVTFLGRLTWTGSSSIEVRVTVHAEDVVTGARRRVSEAYFVYVHVDEKGRSAPVPPLVCRSEADRQAFESALERRAYRLKNRRPATGS